MAFIFGGNTPWTYDELQRQREIANALAMNTETPRNVGEGLNAIGNALAYRGITKRAGKEEARMKGEHDALRGTIFGGDGGMPSAPSGAPSGPTPAFVPPDPNSPGAVASDTMAALGKQVFTPGDKESFIKAMMPHAMKVSEVTGLDPRIVIAQAAQETGWGKSAPGNNFFGIKSHGKGGGNTFATNEVIDGKTVRINDSFRGYDSMGDSAMGYAEFLKENPRYGDMLAAPDLESQIAALGKSGYATDPNYAASVRAIATSIGLPEGYAPGQAQPQGGMDLGALLKFANDPMTSPGERAIVEQLIAQQTQAADPMKAIELERAQLELAQMKNPQPGFKTLTDDEERQMGLDPSGIYQTDGSGKIVVTQAPKEPAKPPASVSEYQFYVEEATRAGKTPMSYEEFLVSDEKASVPPGAPNIGTIPQGYEAIQDPASGAWSMRPIPGGPEDKSKKEAVAESNAAIASEVVTTAADRALAAASKRTVGGLAGAMAAYNPSTQNAEVYRQVDVLKSNAKVENLTAMRAASPTGGALGSVTEKEAEMLAQKSGALDPASPNFERDLLDYTRTMLQVIHGKDAGDAIFAQKYQQPAAASGQPDADGWVTLPSGVRIREVK